MRTTMVERAEVLHLKAGDVQAGDEVVYRLDSPTGVSSHVVTRAESVSFDERRTWITLTGPESTRPYVRIARMPAYFFLGVLSLHAGCP